VVATIDGASINGNKSATGGGGGLMAVVQASEISIGNSEFVGNQTDNGEGGAVNVAVTNGAFYGSYLYAAGNANTNGAAGAVQVTASASDFGLEYSGFFDNSATTCGGGLRLTGSPNQASVGHSTFYYNSASCGGGMSMFSPSSSAIMVEVKYSEFSRNQATSASSVTGGGAIFAEFSSSSSMFLKNSTISGNESAGVAGGVRLKGDMSAQIKYSTIANNYTYNQGGGVYNTSTSCSINNSILAGNTNQTGLYQDLKGSQDCSVSNSLLAGAKYSDYSDGGGNILDTAPKLGPLADNGGNAGYTHALMADSPAIDAGSAGSGAPNNDQRGPGFPRVIGPAIDMGAYEFSAAPGVIFQDRFEQL
ncbi:MAG TPA: choice-of-anchor Q domain-containing protein, partial [Wenzhouxiangella sp.]|nr:choice-of-anchor Q domain-containing protein [Wenzhouxiangella sp.]